MMFSCPGLLYAKSLLESGAPHKDYDEWFAHPEILAFREVVDSFDLELRSGPVIAVVNLLRDRSLVFRYSWCATCDQNGRRHVRREAFMVDGNQCRAMLGGRFTAAPDADLKKFSVETSTEDALGEVLVDRVCGFGIKVFARQRSDFEFITKQTQLPRKEIAAPQISKKKKAEDEVMFKFLSALFACGCLVGGWYYWTANSEIARLERELDQTKSEMKACQDRILELQRWVENRQNFERNLSSMREIISELGKSVAKAESLMANIDGVSASGQRDELRGRAKAKDCVSGRSAATTNVSERLSERLPESQNKKKESSFLGAIF